MVSGPDKNNRDLLIYLLWKTGKLSNNEIGHLFEVSDSVISHVVRSLKTRMRKDRRLFSKFNKLDSPFKV